MWVGIWELLVISGLPCVKMTRNWSFFDGNRGNQRFSNTLKKHFPGEPCTEKWQGIKVQASRKVGKQKFFRITIIPPSGWGVRWRIIAFCKGTVRAPSRKMMPKRWKIIPNHEKSRFLKSLKIKSWNVLELFSEALGIVSGCFKYFNPPQHSYPIPSKPRRQTQKHVKSRESLYKIVGKW